MISNTLTDIIRYKAEEAGTTVVFVDLIKCFRKKESWDEFSGRKTKKLPPLGERSHAALFHRVYFEIINGLL